MKDRSKVLAVINTGKRKDSSESLTTQVIKGGPGGSTPSGSYLQKSIWDKCWEIRATENGEEYLFGKLPVGLQFDLTSFIDSGLIDLPSLYDGIPIDNQTLYWEETTEETTDEAGNVVTKVVKVLKSRGSGEGTIKDIVVKGAGNAITGVELSADKTGLVFTKDMTFVEKTYVDSEFVTMSTVQTVTGQKNFTGGILVNGEELKYNASSIEWLFQKNMRLRNGNSNYGMTLYFGDGSYCYITEPSDDKMKIHASNGVVIETGSSYYVEVDSKGIKINGGIIMYNGSYWEIEGDVLVTGDITFNS